MKFLVDSCISRFAVDALRKSGYEVLWLPEMAFQPIDMLYRLILCPYYSYELAQ
jgi:hypothetical protein